MPQGQRQPPQISVSGASGSSQSQTQAQTPAREEEREKGGAAPKSTRTRKLFGMSMGMGIGAGNKHQRGSGGLGKSASSSTHDLVLKAPTPRSGRDGHFSELTPGLVDEKLSVVLLTMSSLIWLTVPPSSSAVCFISRWGE